MVLCRLLRHLNMIEAPSKWMYALPPNSGARAPRPPPKRAYNEEREMRLDDLHLWYLGDPKSPRYVGPLRLISTGKGVSLRYHAHWLRAGFPLSEDLPLIDTEHLPPGRLASDGERAVGAVDDARPDRWGEKVIRLLDGPKRLSLMEYLYYAGAERFGALGVSTSATTYSPRSGGPLPRLTQVQRLSEVIAKIEAAEPVSEVEARMVRTGGSLGGAKPKALIEVSGEQWVVKFYNGEPIDTPLVEHATMTLARDAGITVAHTQVIRLTAANAIAICRFDREQDLRIHSISAGTAIRAATASGTEPEIGYPELARIIRRIGVTQDNLHQRDARELFRRMVFNILIDNTDDHEKNHSLLIVNPYENGRLRLAPAYDVLPTNSGQGHQEFICGDHGHDSTLENAMSQCEAFGLTPPQAAAEAVAVIHVVNGWKEHFQRCGVSARDIESLQERIDCESLLSQRTAFTPRRYSQAAARPRKKSPFRST
jgi:serine/threonine-protein kinase HipA